MSEIAALDHLIEDATTAHCARCDRSARITMEGDVPWCGWCGGPTRLVLRRVRVLHEATARAYSTHGQFVDPEHVPLQPLRIPAGWTVAYNNGLYAVEPTETTVQWWWIFKQDMLVLVHAGRDRLLDLGWSPEMDFADGRYRLSLHQGDHHGPELHRFETQDLPALVHEIERLLLEVSLGRL